MGSRSAGLEETLVGFGVPDSRALLGFGIRPGGGALGLVDVPILAEQGGSGVASCWKRARVGRTVEKERARGTSNSRRRMPSGEEGKIHPGHWTMTVPRAPQILVFNHTGKGQERPHNSLAPLFLASAQVFME